MKLIAAAALAFIAVSATAQDQPQLGPKPSTDPSHVEIPGEQPFDKMDLNLFNPVMWIGVKACGEYVVWLVFPDHISVVDKSHRPKDFKEFLKALEMSKIPSDERTIDCTSSDL